MTNLKTSFVLKSLFGRIPATSKIEADEAALIKEHADFIAFGDSDDLKTINELEKIVNSAEFKKKLEALKADTFDKTKEYKKLQEYNGLLKNSLIKKYKNSDSIEEVEKIKNADLYKRFDELENLVNSKEFLALKAEKEDKERYKKSDEYLQQEKLKEMMARDDVKKYFGLLKSNKFDELESWEMTFFDDFEAAKLDASKWITNYYWGKALLNDGYSLATDKHFNTNGKNIDIKDSVCKIITKEEKAEGKTWHPRIGFYPKQYSYTSGLISTGESFRQKYGRFEAKIRIDQAMPVTHAFWMVSEKMLPEIDIFKTDAKNKMSLTNHWGDNEKSKLSKYKAGKYVNNFFIYSLEWTESKLTWRINNIVVREETQGVPKEPMYLIFSSGLQTEPTAGNLPSTMEIDWVKCYKKK